MPTQIGNATGWTSVSADYNHSCVMDAGVTFTATPVTEELAFMLVEASS